MVNFRAYIAISISIGRNPKFVQVFFFIIFLTPQIHRMDNNSLVSCDHGLEIQYS